MAVPVRHEDAIYSAAIAAAGAAVPGALLPASDLPLLAGIWALMAGVIAETCARSFDGETLTKFCLAVLQGGLLYKGGSAVFVWILNLFPAVGTLTAAGINAVLNFIYTIRFGIYVSKIMESPNFSMADVPLKSLASAIFGPPTLSEVRHAVDYMRSHI